MKNMDTAVPAPSMQTATHTPKRALARYEVVAHCDYPVAPFSMCFTVEAMNAILTTVGAYPPETGAKIFSRVNRMGVETVEFDQQGSMTGNSVVYRPDTRWGHKRLEYHMSQPEMRLWTGDIHSHPRGTGIPSYKSGPGLGDLGYVEEVFEQNEMMEYFLLPILTDAGTERPLLHPWVCQRGNPVRLLTASVFVYDDDSNFPERIFNPVWELQQKEAPQPKEDRWEAYGVMENPDMSGKMEVTAPHTVANTPQESSRCIQPTGGKPNKNSRGRASAPETGIAWNLNALQQKITEQPQINKHEMKITIRLNYGDIVIDAHCDVDQPQQAPKLFLTRQNIRCSIPQEEWERFRGTSQEERLLRCCNEYVARLREQAGEHPETAGPQVRTNGDKIVVGVASIDI